MRKEIIRKPEVKTFIDTINNVSKIWCEIPLPDHPIDSIYNRKLVVTGFITPEMEKDLEDRIYVNVRQHLSLKSDSTNAICKNIKMPDWVIYESNREEVRGQDGAILMDEEVTYDENDVEIERVPVPVTTSSIKYVRFLISTKSAHIVDVLEQFMSIYSTKFAVEIDNI